LYSGPQYGLMIVIKGPEAGYRAVRALGPRAVTCISAAREGASVVQRGLCDGRVESRPASVAAVVLFSGCDSRGRLAAPRHPFYHLSTKKTQTPHESRRRLNGP